MAGFFIGIVVGLTGMGGGALMTPVLVLFFNVPPLAAVSNDLVVSAVMKPVGATVHLRRGTVYLPIVGWLCVGSVPCAFLGVLISRALGQSGDVQEITKFALGIALLIATAGLVYRSYLRMVTKAKQKAGNLPPEPQGPVVIRPRRLPTVIVGAIGGVIVGMTSVGSGSLIIIAMLSLYPAMKASGLVGTDLVQAVPLVISAALGHILFGDFQFDLTASLLLGCLPGVYLGARMSSHAPDGIIRRALTVVLLASALKLLGASNVLLVVILSVLIVVGPPLWMYARKRQGLQGRILPRVRPRQEQTSRR
ncbi:MAG: sulfite exporter TauE/SafE family protein [Geodermatophilaceae bacterium]|nr:sulfite exporter TauE/SafE family protein [Geodermatophilaceae bacterium]